MVENKELLKIFISNLGDFVSGEDLAGRFQVSRVAIRKRVDSLEKKGFKFKAIRNKGYSLESFPSVLNEDLINAYASLLLTHKKIYFYEAIDSTNSQAERILAEGEHDPIYVVYARQDSGRGRRGRDWHSPAGNNIYLSTAFRPMVQVQRMQLVTLWLGVALCEFFSKRLQADFKIKWPNDILYKNKKVAGMLTEARVDSERMREIVFGLGINVNSDIDCFPLELRNVAASLKDAYKIDVPINEFAVECIQTIEKAYFELIDSEIKQQLLFKWDKYDFLKGKAIKTDLGEGIAEGINAQGSLKIRKKDNSLLVLHAGDVSLGSFKFAKEESD